MQIFIKSVTGKTITLSILPGSTVEEVKAMIQDKEGVPSGRIRLTHNGRPMREEDSMRAHNVGRESTLQASIRLCGGTGGTKTNNQRQRKKDKDSKRTEKDDEIEGGESRMAHEVGDDVEIRLVLMQPTEGEERADWVQGVILSARDQPEEAYRVGTKQGVIGATFTRDGTR